MFIWRKIAINASSTKITCCNKKKNNHILKHIDSHLADMIYHFVMLDKSPCQYVVKIMIKCNDRIFRRFIKTVGSSIRFDNQSYPNRALKNVFISNVLFYLIFLGIICLNFVRYSNFSLLYNEFLNFEEFWISWIMFHLSTK